MEKKNKTEYIKLDFEQARAKHLLFKSKLRSILYGIDVDEIPLVSQYECAVGKWIYGHALTEYGHIPEIHELESVHADIHTLAKELITLYKSGQVIEARNCLDGISKIADTLVQLLFIAELKLNENQSGSHSSKDYSDLLAIKLQELTDLQKANHELDLRIQQSEEQFNTLVNSIQNLAWMADGDGYIFWYNQRWYEYTGKTLEDMKGWGWQSVHDPDILPLVLEQWKYSINSGNPFEMVFPLKGADNSFRSFLTRVFPIRNKYGKVDRWFGTNTDINEQRKISETLIESVKEREVQMQTILQYAPDAVITIDEHDTIISWNPQAENIFGWTEIEVLGKMLTETIIPERYHDHHIHKIRNFLSIGVGPVMNKPIEISAIRKNKSEFPIELKISSSKINDRYIFIGFFRDITIRKEAEETILNKTNQLVEAQQLAHIGSWEWDIRNNKIEWSDELYRIFGLSPQTFEATYENYLKYIHPDDRERVDGLVQQAFKDHNPFNFFHKASCADGAVRILSSTGKVFTNSEGNPIRMSGTAQDVTEQKKYEAELKASEERFFKIFDSNPVPMILSEIKTNKIKYANNLFYAAFGYSEHEVIGYSSEELNLMSPEENERVVGAILSILQDHRSPGDMQSLLEHEREELLLKLKHSDAMKDFEICYTRKNGNTFPAFVSFEIIRFGGEGYTIASYQDITEIKRAQTQLKNQNEQLEKMNKELQSFAYVSSHDLQEPLRKIQTFANLILENESQNLSENGKEQFTRLHKAAERMQTLIEDLLAYSRTSTVGFHFENTNLRTIVDEIKEELKEELELQQAEIEAKDLCEMRVIVFQFRQLLHNLIGNALKFSKPGVPPIIHIKCKIARGSELDNPDLIPKKRYCQITFTDNGIGFESQYSEKIFEVFQRLHGKEVYPGTGIGLAIVKKIVANHNGFVTASGELNKGATFDIYIPSS